MSALVLDAGPLVAVDRNDRTVFARLRAAQRCGLELRSHAFVMAQVWRDGRGRQANLARLLRAVDVVPVDADLGRACGELIGRAGTADPIDAAVVLIADSGDRIMTSDPDDLARLVSETELEVVLVPA